MAKKKSGSKNKLDRLFERMLANKTLRTDVVRRDFEWFFPIYFHKRLEYPTAPFQREMIKLLRDCKKKFIVITAFRGSAKTTLTSVTYVLWAVFGVQQRKLVLIVSQTEEKARRLVANIRRQLETNALLRGDLGPIDEEKDQWGAKAFIIRKLNAKVAAASVGQSVRGLLHDEHRPDLVICDDLESLESVQTQESRDKLSEWFEGELLPIGDKRTRFIVIGNLLHEDSLMRRLQHDIEIGDRDGEFREYSFFEDDGVTPRWRGKYPTQESVDEERRMIKDPIAWAREYLLKILPRDEQLIRPEWIKYYDALPEFEDSSWCATGIDLAISKDERADFTAMVSARVYGWGEKKRIYILPNVVNKRLSFLDTVEQAELISDGLGESMLCVEDVGYQSAVVEKLEADGYTAVGVKIHGRDKYARLSAVSHLVQSGAVLFPRGMPLLVNQLTGFGSEKHDDLVDAFSILLSKIMEEDRRPHVAGMNFKGPYNGEFDHLPPDEREHMMQVRENLRNLFLV